ncbi:MAG: non-reducing end alpha-L-arabinofuranosidase family hydrolase [Phycisphaerae bacterium]|nr:non-reducing end alpha-L-arabinofuranosidase family hydrolase [Phycisphaerae bacterium]
MVRFTTIVILSVLFSALCPAQQMATGVTQANALSTGSFNWITTPPVLEPMEIDGEKWLSVKDPSIVRYKDRWHLFCTVRGTKRTHAIIYLTFAEWPQAKTAAQQVLKCHPGYFCAPQVFYFTPHKKWYMICQASDDSWEPKYQPAFSTTKDITKPDSWSKLTPLFKTKPTNINAWLDFWVICDDTKSHLFFTSLDGKMWRAETSLDKFPAGWSTPVLALQGDVFEASHTYQLKGSNKYLTLIEAQNGHGWRYYKAYLADHLDGDWTPLAADKDKSFASMLNVKHPAERWTDVISHGELLRAGHDEKLIVDPDNLRLLFQGVTNRGRAGKPYGQIPWRLGILKPAPKPTR